MKKKIQYTPIVAPSFSPEVDLMINVGGLLTYNPQNANSDHSASSMPFFLGYSTNKSFIANFRPFVYVRKDAGRIYGNIWYRNMPDNYWGVGYENGRNVVKSDSTTRYKRRYWQINLASVWKIKPNLFAGINFDFNETQATQMNPRMINDPDIIQYGSDVRNSGIGIVAQFDSRDLAVNAYSGMLISLTSTFYGEYLGGSNTYSVYELDYRQYKQARKPRQTLAWQVKMRMGGGSMPWPEVAQLGNPFDLRGYTWGRYRDRQMLLGMVEYRHMFMRKRPNKKGVYESKSGFVTWLATGSIANTPTELNNWLPNFGVGYRFEVQERMNARIDFGFGNDQTGFYVSFNEAF